MKTNQKLKTLLAVTTALLVSMTVTAADVNWNPPVVGDGGSVSWSNVLNWETGVPGALDTAVFSGTSAYNFQPSLDVFSGPSVSGLRLGGASVVSLTLGTASDSKTTSGANASGSETILLTNTTGLSVGHQVTGSRIPVGTFITAINGNEITISRPTSGGVLNDATNLNFISSLRVGSDGIVQVANTTVTNTIIAPLVFSDSQTWDLQSARTLAVQGSIYLDNHDLTVTGVAGSTVSFNGPQGGDASLRQSIGGTGSIIIDTEGTVSFGSGSDNRMQNSFSGGVILNQGRMSLQGGNAGGVGGTMGGLGTGVLTINGGEIFGGGNIAGRTLTISGQVWNTDWNFAGGRDIHMGFGGIALGTAAGESRTLFANGGNYTLTLGGGIANGTTANQFIVDGSSRIQLTGASTYTGGTIVRGATLIVDNTGGSGTGAGVVAVENNGTLTGTGSIAGGVDIEAGSTLSGSLTVGGNSTIAGLHRPGNSPGIQSFGGNLSYSSGASVEWELVGNTTVNAANPNALFDSILVQGDLSFNGPTNLNLVFNLSGSDVDWSDGFWDADKEGTDGWLLYQVDGTLSGFSNLSIATFDWLDSSGTAFSTVRDQSSFSLYQDGSNVYLTYAIPEPSTLVLMGVALSAAFLSFRRKRKV